MPHKQSHIIIDRSTTSELTDEEIKKLEKIVEKANKKADKMLGHPH